MTERDQTSCDGKGGACRYSMIGATVIINRMAESIFGA
ncbi:hypothetical protein GGE15_006794 [Rhizobium esperanzae]|uniref:Uncharacterized protein n=1 Tax=Rhizobium esperanzae TaxID=1967781 RepID=A0A7W6UUL8_9HYPH|nr:hypothetical protein [Rhizobium esperanzae]